MPMEPKGTNPGSTLFPDRRPAAMLPTPKSRRPNVRSVPFVICDETSGVDELAEETPNVHILEGEDFAGDAFGEPFAAAFVVEVAPHPDVEEACVGAEAGHLRVGEELGTH